MRGSDEAQTRSRPAFVTDTGVAVPAVTADEMREVDRIAIEETGPDLLQMMENAGRELAASALELLGTGGDVRRSSFWPVREGTAAEESALHVTSPTTPPASRWSWPSSTVSVTRRRGSSRSFDQVVTNDGNDVAGSR